MAQKSTVLAPICPSSALDICRETGMTATDVVETLKDMDFIKYARGTSHELCLAFDGDEIRQQAAKAAASSRVVLGELTSTSFARVVAAPQFAPVLDGFCL